MTWVKSLLVAAFAVFVPIKGMLITTGILILADTVSGIMAARKRGERISSAKLRHTITKSFVYLCGLMVGFLVETFMLDGSVPISKIMAGLIGVVEGKSLLENLNTIHGGNIFASLIKTLGSKNAEPKE